MAESVNPQAIAQQWVHSHEEDGSDTFVFRPNNFSFPPSRGRRTLSLRPDGSYEGQVGGPDDRPVPQSGNWVIRGNKLELDSGSSGSPVELHIESVDPTKMVVKRTPG
ncbi:MAG: hypothetical protein QOH65_748 [Methylobacteriaceae bacterium]|jgi:hypothetical protein|nr:hypothetical protein [Methylobacteriaceae bacterium]